eukprot:CAMPEP_0197635762 /NCGR_PEP_ID=MMETSP1338-20131121/11487_1 /TAXON_ID=43686 ORGANISM="Pelagodinium beii, Strain RCC1491" /NCGR_SAMPLE_ID=MMETSP1338 /ASSEMBLY_ACC=CAM_ASM_000754 /LENGTH=614 /DNA_ID=CAMNT_0043207887 /DNA_START=356 /DNA_END=2200 /DNA_ORIENTATION=-
MTMNLRRTIAAGAPVFQDKEYMKARVREQLYKEPYHVGDYYKTEGIFQAVARSDIFDRLTLLVISANALYIWIDTDLNPAASLLDAHVAFVVAEQFFCVYFTSEWIIRFCAFNHKIFCLQDAWFIFDTVLVSVMIAETWIMTLVLFLMGGTSSLAIDTSVLKMIRLVRLTRMARMAKLLRALPELLILLKGVRSALRSVFFTLCLLLIVLYIFGIAFTQVTSGSQVGDDFFPFVTESMKTLLIYGTLLDNVAGLMLALQQESVWYWWLFLLFILLAALTVMNMLIGVLCEVVGAVAATEKEENMCAFVKTRLQAILYESGIDEDGNGRISRAEFDQLLDNNDATRMLAEVGVDPIGLVELADLIFEQDGLEEEGSEEETVSDVKSDGEEEEPSLSFGAFMEVVLQLRGTNVATVKDVMDMRKYVKRVISDNEKHLQQHLQNNDLKLDLLFRHLGAEPPGKQQIKNERRLSKIRHSQGADTKTSSTASYTTSRSDPAEEMKNFLASCERNLLSMNSEFARHRGALAKDDSGLNSTVEDTDLNEAEELHRTFQKSLEAVRKMRDHKETGKGHGSSNGGVPNPEHQEQGNATTENEDAMIKVHSVVSFQTAERLSLC